MKLRSNRERTSSCSVQPRAIPSVHLWEESIHRIRSQASRSNREKAPGCSTTEITKNSSVNAKVRLHFGIQTKQGASPP